MERMVMLTKRITILNRFVAFVLMSALVICTVSCETPPQKVPEPLVTVETESHSVTAPAPPVETPTVSPKPSPTVLQPLVYIPPTVIKLGIEPLPDYEPDAEVLIVRGEWQSRFFDEYSKTPLLIDREGRTLALPDGTEACMSSGLSGGCCSFTDERPQAIFLMKGREYAVMRLDGEVVTDFSYIMDYECDWPHWSINKGYLLARKGEHESDENNLAAYSVVDIRTGKEIISDELANFSFGFLQDGVIKFTANEVTKLFDYQGNLLYEGNGRYTLDLSSGELIQSNLPKNIHDYHMGDYIVLTDFDAQIMTVLDINQQHIHTQRYDGWLGFLDDMFIFYDDDRFTVIASERGVVFFNLVVPFEVNDAFFSDDQLFLVHRYRDDETNEVCSEMISIDAQDAVIPLGPYVFEPKEEFLSPYIMMRTTGDDMSFAMIDKSGRILIDYGCYSNLMEKGGFIFARTDTDYTYRYDIYNTEGVLLLTNANAETRLAMPNRMIVYDPDTGEPFMLLFDGSTRVL